MNYIYIFHISLIFFGYPFFSAFGSLFSTDLFSILYRFLILFSSLVIGLNASRHSYKINKVSVLLLCFLFFYFIIMFLRVFFDFSSKNLDLKFYILQPVFFILIPAFSLFLINYEKINLKSALNFFFFISLFNLIVNFNIAFWNHDISLYGSRLGTERLNPISLGYSVVLFFLISFITIKSFYIKIIAIFISFFCILLVSSRGALLSFLLILFFVLYKRFKLKLVNLVFLFFVIAIFFISSFLIFINFFPEFQYIVIRLGLNSSGDDTIDITSGRNELWFNSLEQVESNIFFGDSVLEDNSNFYPHNLILETLLATGYFGVFYSFLFFSISVFFVFARGVAHCDFYFFFLCVFIVYLINSLFSGSFFSSVELFCSLVILYSLNHNQKLRLGKSHK